MGVMDDGCQVLCVYGVQPLFRGSGELEEGSGLLLTSTVLRTMWKRGAKNEGSKRKEGGQKRKKMGCELGLGVEDVKHQA